jgi:hypothetical protein
MFEKKQIYQLNIHLSVKNFRQWPEYVKFEQQADKFFQDKDDVSHNMQYGSHFSRYIFSAFTDEIEKIIHQEFPAIVSNEIDNKEEVTYHRMRIDLQKWIVDDSHPCILCFESYHEELLKPVEDFLENAIPVLANHYLNMNQCEKWTNPDNENNIVYGVDENQIWFFFNQEILHNYPKVLFKHKLNSELPINEQEIKSRPLKL